MKIFLIILAIYIILSGILYVVLDRLYKSGKLKYFKNVSNKALFYLIQFTWALLPTLLGCIVAFALIITGHKPVRYGMCFCFEMNVNWGLELGIFFIAPPKSKGTKNHEHGHAIQNIYLGPFALLCVSIPSCLRFWYREIYQMIHPGVKLVPYDSIWFEGTASGSGREFMNNYSEDMQ